MYKLPDWMDCSIALANGFELMPIEQFIYDQEPSGYKDEQRFREQLKLALIFAKENPEEIS